MRQVGWAYVTAHENDLHEKMLLVCEARINERIMLVFNDNFKNVSWSSQTNICNGKRCIWLGFQKDLPAHHLTHLMRYSHHLSYLMRYSHLCLGRVKGACYLLGKIPWTILKLIFILICMIWCWLWCHIQATECGTISETVY